MHKNKWKFKVLARPHTCTVNRNDLFFSISKIKRAKNFFPFKRIKTKSNAVRFKFMRFSFCSVIVAFKLFFLFWTFFSVFVLLFCNFLSFSRCKNTKRNRQLTTICYIYFYINFNINETSERGKNDENVYFVLDFH